MRIFLAGEGPTELGDQARDAQNRATPPAPGVLEALLAHFVLSFEIVGAVRWKDIRKYRPGAKRSAETRNVLGAVQRAVECKAEALVFSRDRDRDPEREKRVWAGIEEGRDPHFSDGLIVVGGLAVETLEAWVLALDGDTRTEALATEAAKQAAIAKGWENTAHLVEAIRAASLDRVPPDACSLLKWLEQAARLTGHNPIAR